MSVVYLLLPLAILLAAFFVGVFVWAARNGQFDDLETPAHRILHDDDPPRPKKAAERSPDDDQDPSHDPREL